MTSAVSTSRTASIVTSVRRALKPCKQPSIDAPFPIATAELHELGEDRRGRMWYRHPLGELQERARTVTDDEVLPNAPIVEISNVAGTRTFRVFDVHEPGSHERFMAEVGAVAKPKPRARPVDALVGLSILTRADYAGKGARAIVRGCGPIVARLEGKGGIDWFAEPDGTVSWEVPGGESYLLVAAPRVAPLVAPYVVSGKPPACFLCGREAVTVAAGWPTGKPWCGACSHGTARA